MNQIANLKLSAGQLGPIIPDDALSIAMHQMPTEHALIGQTRAKEALKFGLEITSPGYNIYVMGEQATGRLTLINEQIKRMSSTYTDCFDLCYLNNFDDERQPIALKMDAQHSTSLVSKLEAFVDEIINTFPSVFDNPSFQRKKSAILRQNEDKYQLALEQVQESASLSDIALVVNDGDISFSPIVEGEIVSDAELNRFSERQRNQFFDCVDRLEEELNEALIEIPVWQRETAEKLRTLKRETVEQGLRPLIKGLEHEYAAELGVLKYLKKLKPHLIDTVIDMFADEASKDEKNEDYDKRTLLIETYVPNIMVSHSPSSAQPVIYEPNPNYQNLFGKIEYTSVQGSVYTNYRMLVPGALHKANGGYLVLEADKLIEQPYVWDALKRALKSASLKMDLPHQEVGMSNSITQSPQPVDLNIKIILLGSRELYYALQNFDEEFNELVRVLVDFDTEIEVNQTNLNDFFAAVKSHCLKLGLESIDQSAFSALVKHSFRLAEHQNKLSSRFADVLELVNEAHYFANKLSDEELTAEHIQQALSAKRNRSGRASGALFEEIKEGHLLIDTSGAAVGKVNGLTVLQIGETSFGTPARITATVYAGANGVIDIEREVELGQSIHSKGVMLLNGYLGYKYAQNFPLTLSANIALEQSYGYIDGDSASLGELIALISSLTEIPVQQSVAVTGSINQYGEVQAVGGVNEKIEGFYELCKIKGLNKQQAVIIPKSNTINLVLKQEIVEAVKRRAFSIYAVESVDQALEIMMQRPAGKRGNTGRYTKRSVHHAAVERLFSISEIVNGASD